MKVSFRTLVNPLILLDVSMSGFLGDSEYYNEEGKLIFGYWCFCGVDVLSNKYGRDIGGVPYRLDDVIDEFELRDSDMIFLVENDDGVVCRVRFSYSDS